MTAPSRTHQELIEENALLKQRIQELELSDADHQRMEESLKQSEAQYRLLADHMKDQVWLMDLNLKPTYTSPSVEKSRGYTFEEIAQLPLDKHLTATSFQAAMEFFSIEMPKALADPTYFLTRSLELEFYRKDGSTLWVENKFSLIRDENGKPLSLLGVGRDITERKRVEEALQESEERLKNLYQESPIPTFTWQKKEGDFLLIDFNRAAIQLTNGKVRNHLGDSAVKQYKNRPQILSDMNLCFQERSVVSREVTSRHFAPGRLLSVHYGFIPPDLIIIHTEDQTDRKQAVTALQESEEKFRLLVENANDIVYSLTTNGVFTYVSPTWTRILGHDISEVENHPFQPFVHPDDFPGCLELLERTIKTGDKQAGVEYRVLHKDGNWRWHTSNASPIYDASGKVVAYMAIARDVTERKRMEEALLESEEKLQMAMSGAEMGMWDLDLATMSGTIDERAAQILGYRKDEIPSQIDAWDEMTHPDDVPRIKESIQAHLEGRLPVFYTEHRMRTATGEWKWVDGRGKITERHIDGSPIRISGTIHDISERKLAEQAISTAEETYRNIFLNSQIGLFRTDVRTGQLLDANDAVARFIGYKDRASLLADPFNIAEQYVDPCDRENIISLLQAHGEFQNYEARFRRNDDSIILMRFSARLVKEKGWMEGVSEDITERKRLEEELRESENRYRELSIIDDLTQLYNSRHFYQQLRMEIDRVDRYGQPLTLLLLDLDDFKVFNDAYGHVEGDQVLSRLGQVVKRCLRQTDSAYRYGGEEFTILLPMTTSKDGAVTAERIRTEFKEELFSPAPGQGVHVKVSIGLGQYKPQEDMKAFVHRVDQLMYQGKKNGKDRVCVES